MVEKAFLVLLVALVQNGGAPADGVASARLAYEKRTAEIGADLLKTLDDADRAAHQSVDRKKADALSAERAAFRDHGVCPSTAAAAARKQEWNKAREEFRRALKGATDEAFKTFRQDEERDLRTDLEVFNGINDLSPWRSITSLAEYRSHSAWQQSGDAVVGVRDSGGSDCTLRYRLALPTEYELCLHLRRTGGTGSVVVRFTDASGRVIELSAAKKSAILLPVDDASTYVKVTVAKQQTSVDVDGHRIYRWSPDTESVPRADNALGEGVAFALDIEGAQTALRLESIEFKPLEHFEAPPQRATVRADAVIAKASDSALELFKPLAVWRGTEVVTGENINQTLPMVLWVGQRYGDGFDGYVWYPTVSAAVASIRGEIDKSGVVTFTEEVIYGQPAPGRDGLLTGAKFTLKSENRTLEGDGDVWSKYSKETLALHVTLKFCEQ